MVTVCVMEFCDCIYKHPIVAMTEFTEDFLFPFLKNVAKEKEEIILMGDFNNNILNCYLDKDIKFH